MSRTETFNLEITCELDNEYFGDWDSLSPEIKAFWDKAHQKPHCEGEGVIGTWCRHCPWCANFDAEAS